MLYLFYKQQFLLFDLSKIKQIRGDAQLNYKNELYEMRKNFKDKKLSNFRITKPWWLSRNDAMAMVYKDLSTLKKYGQVYYAHIVQANVLLFDANSHCNCPCVILYTTDPITEEDPLILKKYADLLYYYKDEKMTPPDEWQELILRLREESGSQVYTFPCKMGNYSFSAKMQPVMVHRKYIPCRTLISNLLPVVANPDICDSVFILPQKFWTNTFKNDWLNII